jgi:hypothetical protein
MGAAIALIHSGRIDSGGSTAAGSEAPTIDNIPSGVTLKRVHFCHHACTGLPTPTWM